MMMPNIKEAIDADRPLFDFARMWLTVVGFWVLNATIVVQLHRFPDNRITVVTIGIAALIPPLFLAIAMSISLVRSTEAISRSALVSFFPKHRALRWVYGPIAAYVVALSPAGIGIAVGAAIFSAIK